MIVMGFALLLVAWRLTRRTGGWPARTLMAGALLLALGYSVVLPLYQVKVLVPLNLIMFYPNADPAAALGWHLVRMLSMNGGWLLFGLGLLLHARIFETRRDTSPQPATLPSLP
ncbi:hypothetical protein HAHE_12620 [Haloferula helveola]|uniref:Uncharacterized protein n=2 Tax=Haloferula helveola TaxID=490095 RepID=A0ABM7RB64_9BACT|nr:hypothetical protein HAHE_12620 [Haloferula helveola]